MSPAKQFWVYPGGEPGFGVSGLRPISRWQMGRKSTQAVGMRLGMTLGWGRDQPWDDLGMTLG